MACQSVCVRDDQVLSLMDSKKSPGRTFKGAVGGFSIGTVVGLGTVVCALITLWL